MKADEAAEILRRVLRGCLDRDIGTALYMGITALTAQSEAPRLRALIVTYREARQIYEAATAAPNPHAQAPRLPHGSTVARLYREARAALDRAVDP